jgi:hydrogenase maturation factor
MRRPTEPIPRAAPDAASMQRAVGTVVAILDDEVVVNIDGVLRRASAGPVRRLRIGDWVMVGVGSVLGVVDAKGSATR